jgi:hypothetical protein
MIGVGVAWKYRPLSVELSSLQLDRVELEKFIEQFIVEPRRNLRLRTLFLSEFANPMVRNLRFPESKPSTPPGYASYRMDTFYYAVQMSAAEMEEYVRKVVAPLALSE